MKIILFFFLVSVKFVSAQDGQCAETDNNEYIVLAQQFERFLLERCMIEKESVELVQYVCTDSTPSLPVGFHAAVVKNKNYWKIFVSDNSRPSSFLTILEAPLFLNNKTPVYFYAPREEVLGKMKEVVALLLRDEEVKVKVGHTLDS